MFNTEEMSARQIHQLLDAQGYGTIFTTRLDVGQLNNVIWVVLYDNIDKDYAFVVNPGPGVQVGCNYRSKASAEAAAKQAITSGSKQFDCSYGEPLNE